jgi:hypothetical protein
MCYSPHSRRTREHELNENARRVDGVGGCERVTGLYVGIRNERIS